jgi:hypothetical protein
LLWSILAAKFPPLDHVSQIGSYRKYEYIYDIKEDEFPVQINNIKNTKKRNNLKINVFGLLGSRNKITDYSLEPLFISGTKEEEEEPRAWNHLIYYTLTNIM